MNSVYPKEKISGFNNLFVRIQESLNHLDLNNSNLLKAVIPDIPFVTSVTAAGNNSTVLLQTPSSVYPDGHTNMPGMHSKVKIFYKLSSGPPKGGHMARQFFGILKGDPLLHSRWLQIFMKTALLCKKNKNDRVKSSKNFIPITLIVI